MGKNKILVKKLSDSDFPLLFPCEKECFGVNEDYLQMVHRLLVPHAEVFALIEDSPDESSKQKILSSLMVIPISHAPTHTTGGYVAFVATPVKERGHHYFSTLLSLLLEENSPYCLTKKYHFLLVRPTEESLINLYKSNGFTVPINNPYFDSFSFQEKESNVEHYLNEDKPIDVFLPVGFKEVFFSPENLHRELKSKSPCFYWTPDILRFILEESKTNPTTRRQLELFERDILINCPGHKKKENPLLLSGTPFAFLRILNRKLLTEKNIAGSLFIFTLE